MKECLLSPDDCAVFLPEMVEQDKNRISFLLEVMPGINKKEWTERLRKPEKDGLLKWEVFVAKVPMVVRYSLSEKRRSLRELIDGIIVWTAKQE
ncbi:winged helix-turn-helix transcriptional regulator [Sphingobacterium spiritivorum]|uniref:winged helix-turn-helix transcriptional regulator n=1 Tax=Sphingobacterium spiritivorum TaxID=258 RepID=UPI003DA463EC